MSLIVRPKDTLLFCNLSVRENGACCPGMLISSQKSPRRAPSVVASSRPEFEVASADCYTPARSENGHWIPPAKAALASACRKSSSVPAEDFSSRFDRRSGWAGADGTYSVSLPNGSTLWLFSDTFWGDVSEDGRRAPGTAFINNSVALQTPDGELAFYHGREKMDEPKSLFTPPDGKGWFWLHDAVLSDNGKVQIMLGQFDRTPEGGALGFEAVGNWVAELEVTSDGPRVGGYQKIPFFQAAGDGRPSMFFGSAVLPDGNWTYLYGVRDYGFHKESVLARVPAGRIAEADQWEFFAGETWSGEMSKATVVADNVSVEYSVHKSVVGDYVMVAQKGGAGPDVQVRRAPRPEGPWSEPQTVWSAPENSGTDLTYNAKAHPELSDDRGLLVSYNVNTVDWERNLQVADVYRPRFIRVEDPTLLSPR